jgi:hypothetical protein
MLRTCNPVATSLAALAERRALTAPGAGVLSQTDILAQTSALRDRLVLLQELVAWLHDQLEARRSFSPAPRRQSAEAAEHRGIDHGPVG